MSTTVYPVILSGGAGTRLWPLSRKLYPKQLIDLMHSGQTMIQATAERTRDLGPPIIVCSEEHRFMVAQQLSEIGISPKQIVLEPEAKNTAPAILVAALSAMQSEPESLIAVFPADHHIEDRVAFQVALGEAIQGAHDGKLMTFGIVPDKPETGYGYIKANQENSTSNNMSVDQFVEKPDLKTAISYLDSGDYFWNSGMFVFTAKQVVQELGEFFPNMLNSCELALKESVHDLDFTRLDVNHFAKSESISIDYALMERSQNVGLVPLNAGWSDIGNWESLSDAFRSDENENVIVGDVMTEQSENCFVYAQEKLTTLLGVEDLVVVDTDDALLIAHKNAVQDVKVFPKKLEQAERNEYLHHRKVHRPWGNYDSIQNGNRFQVKKLTVMPGESLSLQLHHHRAEHWVVVEGTAKVQLGEDEVVLSENESVYIPIGTKHRLTNPGKIPLSIIEVQSGTYLGEDDIVRLEDVYQRTQ